MTSTTHDGRLAPMSGTDEEPADQGRLLPDGGEEAAPKRGGGRLRAAGFVLLAAGVAVIAWYLSELVSNRSGPPTSQLPVLSADAEPVKARPEDPGGADIPNRDKLVYKSLDPASATAPAQIEQLLPAPEEPMEKPLDPGPLLGPLASVSIGEAWLTPQASDLIAAPAANADVVDAIATLAESAGAESSNPDTLAEVAPASGGVWLQLGSLRDEKGAESEWSRLSRKHPDALKGMTSRVDKADLGAKGIWYRLRAGPYADKTEAERACKAMLSAGQACKISTL